MWITYVLIGIAAIVVLWLVFKLLGGCLVRVLLTLVVLAVVALAIWFLVTR